MALSTNYSPDGIELLPINKQQQQPVQQSSCLTLTPKMKRNVGKKLQFSTPECSVTPISALPGSSGRVLVPSRKRYLNFLFFFCFLTFYYADEALLVSMNTFFSLYHIFKF